MPPLVPEAAAPRAAAIQRAARPELRLDLACGQNPREGFEGVDLWAGATHRVNLLRFPWPWQDGEADELHIPAETFLYLNREWRTLNRLAHYNVRCDFGGPGGVGPPLVEAQVPAEETLRAPEAQAARFNTLWNTIADWSVRMVAR